MNLSCAADAALRPFKVYKKKAFSQEVGLPPVYYVKYVHEMAVVVFLV
jgi:hypothetical protein